MQTQFADLRTRLQEVTDLELAAALLNWDQSTYMPSGGAEARGRQLSILGRLAHEHLTDPAIGRLIEDLEPYAAQLPAASDEARLIRVAKRDYQRAVQVPSSFMAEFYSHTAASYEIWAKARPANDWATIEPYLEKTLELSRRYASYFPGHQHIADPLIDISDHGMTVATVRELFNQLRGELVPLVQKISEQTVADDSCLHQHYPEDKQLAFGLEVIKRFGYDFN